MNCEQAVELLTGAAGPASAADRRLAGEHAAACADCRGAVVSVHALRVLSLMPAAAAPEGSFRRAIALASAPQDRERRSDRSFWLGLGAGAAMAACVAIAVLAVLSFGKDAPDTNPEPASTTLTSGTPQLALALNETRAINISLTSSETLSDAEIRITLSGTIGLEGYAGQRELSWRTNLDAGDNQLSLPLVATGTDGGQLLVEVIHEGKRRTFLVDVLAQV